MKKKINKNAQNVICSASIICFVLSTLLIFVIPLWWVMIANACEIVLFRIIFMNAELPKKWFIVLYVVVCCFSIGIMVLIMKFPSDICSGNMRSFSDIKLDNFIHKYHIKMGIMLLVFILHYVIIGIIGILCVLNGIYDLAPYFLSTLLASMGGLILANFHDPTLDGGLNVLIVLSVIYVGIIDVVQIVMERCSYGGGSSGGGNSDEYDIIIIKK